MRPQEKDSRPLRCAVLTPAGRGAIAVVQVAGERAVEIVDRLFHPAGGKGLAERPVNQIAFGRWGGEAGEEVVVSRREAGVEIHCHGGRAAVEAICRALGAAGCQRIEASEWLALAEPDLLAREARLALASAVTERTAGMLLDQYHGALRDALRLTQAQLEAGDLQGGRQALETLLDRWSIGRWLTRPARVVLTGPPNVGKSSLINALVGYERAIVFDAPGTTRDAVAATTAIDGWPVELMDTAGLRAAASSLEQAGIDRAEQAIAAADLLLVVDEASNWPRTLQVTSPATPLLHVANKIDLLTGDARQPVERQAEANRSLILTSATTGEGIPLLLERVARAIAPLDLAPGAAIPFAERHHDLLAETLAHLAIGRPDAALRALQAL